LIFLVDAMQLAQKKFRGLQLTFYPLFTAFSMLGDLRGGRHNSAMTSGVGK
jgi:hypothetical protein